MPIIKKPDNAPSLSLKELIPQVLKNYAEFSESPALKQEESGCSELLKTQQTTARITTVKDNVGKLWVIKEFPWYCTQESFVKAILDFQNDLFGKIPIPKILPNTKGDLYTAVEANEAFFFLQEFIPAKGWNQDLNQAKGLGRLLARFHTIGFGKQKEGIYKESIFEFSSELLKLTEEIDTPDWNLVKKEYIQRILDELQRCKSHAIENGYNDLLQVIHADYNYTNVLFNESGNPVALLDFDNTVMDHPVHDVAQALIYMGCISLKKGTPFFAQIRPEQERASLMTVFLEEYAEGNQDLLNKMIPLLHDAIKAVFVKIIVVGFLRRDFPFSSFQTYYESLDSIIAFIDESISANSVI